MLGIPVHYIENFSAILAVLDSKIAIPIAEEFEAFCNHHLDEKFADKKYSWNHHNPSLHVPYLHGGTYSSSVSISQNHLPHYLKHVY